MKIRILYILHFITLITFGFLIYSMWLHPSLITRVVNVFDLASKKSPLNYTENLSWKQKTKPEIEGIYYEPKIIFDFEDFVLLQTAKKIVRDPLLGTQFPLFFLSYYMNKSQSKIMIKMTFAEALDNEAFKSYMVRNLIPSDFLEPNIVHDILTMNSNIDYLGDEIPMHTILTFHFDASTHFITQYVNSDFRFKTNNEDTYYHFLYHFFEIRGEAFSFRSGLFREISPEENFLKTNKVVRE